MALTLGAARVPMSISQEENIMSYLTRVLGQTLGVASRVHTLQVADRDARSLSDIGVADSEAARARFKSLRFGEPVSSFAARLGINGR